MNQDLWYKICYDLCVDIHIKVRMHLKSVINGCEHILPKNDSRHIYITKSSVRLSVE